tara:strand:+ start:6873 stop:8000 length:1128 start_codon:yes stop_codon:yes gene_type:complete
MHAFLAIIWDINPEVFGFIKDNVIPVRWYGLLFASTFLIGYKLMDKIFKKEKAPDEWLDKVFIYVIIATIIGARLGHVLFYGPYHTPDGTGYFDQPLSILKIWEGGLASHGAAIGIIVALILYSKRVTKRSVLWILDRVVITVAIAGALIRTGNLMNSEMIGKPSDAGLQVVFTRYTEDYIQSRLGDALDDLDFESTGENIERGDTAFAVLTATMEVNNRYNPTVLEEYIKNQLPYELGSLHADNKHVLIDPQTMNLKVTPSATGSMVTFTALGVIRHPAQLYEAISYLIIFLVLYWMYWQKGLGNREGLIFGAFLVLVFGARFIIEFLKENQVDFEDELALNMGQNLSIPLVLAGIFFIVRAMRKPEKTYFKQS